MTSKYIAAALAAIAALPVLAQSAAEDEARIEILVGLEQAAKRGSTFAPVAPASDTTVPPAAAAAPDVAAASTTVRAQPGAAAVPAPGDATSDDAAFAVDPGEPSLVYENPEAQPADPNVIALDALDRHVGESVRVRSHGGRTRVGTIESVGAQGITLKSPMGGGYARYTLPYSQITRVEKR